MNPQIQSRRSFRKTAALAGSALSLNILAPREARAAVPTWGGNIPGFGPLTPTRDFYTGQVMLEVPKGFKYTLVSARGQIMPNGKLTPGAADGMGAFAYNGKIRLVRNHEQSNGAPIGNLPYDPIAAGGTTTLTVDPVTRKLEDIFVSSSGTIRNCAGGVTPWGTWITCEETNQYNAATGKQHGYSFEVPAFASSEVAIQPLKGMGLLYPEAVAIDPSTGIAYITMDRNPSGLFRFIPAQYGKLGGAGRLQMLAVGGQPQLNTSLDQTVGRKLPVTWVDVTSPTDEAAYRSDALVAFREGYEKGGASFSRLEGMWHNRNSIFFATTSGGVGGFGQIFELHLKAGDYQELELIFESTAREQLDAPDNLCVSPQGQSIILCEDGSGAEYLHLLQRSGNHIYRLAKNIVPGQEGSEWAGACFAPDGKTLFANIQGAGMTFALWTDNWGIIQ